MESGKEEKIQKLEQEEKTQEKIQKLEEEEKTQGKIQKLEQEEKTQKLVLEYNISLLVDKRATSPKKSEIFYDTEIILNRLSSFPIVYVFTL
jgi:hypothetical protein